MKRQTIHEKIESFLIAVLLLFTLATPAFAAPDDRRTVRVGYFDFGGMMEGAASDEEKHGYAYEYLMQISMYTGWTYEFVPGTFAELYEKCKNGEIDLLPYTNYNEQRTREVLFSENTLLEEEYYITVKTDDNLFVVGKIGYLNGCSISTMRGADYNQLLVSYLQRNNISANIRYYDHLEESWDALRKDEVKATIFTNSAFNHENWKCLDSFGKKSTYIAVSKQRADLLEQLNDAANQMKIDSPTYLGKLYEKYFSDNPMRSSLTQEEQLFLVKHPVLRVGVLFNDAPYLCTLDHSTHAATGATVDITQGIIDRLHLGIRAEYYGYDTMDELLQALNQENIDVFLPCYSNANYAQEHSLLLSNAVFSSMIELVYKKWDTSEKAWDNVAVPQTGLETLYMEEYYPQCAIVPVATVKDALKHVNREKVTGAIILNSSLHRLKESYSSLTYTTLPEGYSTCYATIPENNVLIRILNHGLNFFTQTEISSIVAKYAPETKITLLTYLATSEEAIFLMLALAIVLFALIYMVVKANRLKQAAEAAYQAKVDFLFRMSHDIRTPMNAMLGYTEIAIRNFDDQEKTKDSLQKIKTSGGHLTKLINDILQMSQFESDNLTLTEDPLDLHELVTGIEHMTKALAVPKNITVEFVEGNVENQYVYFDQLRIHQILINLISNAVKFTPVDGKVLFRLDQVSKVDKEKAMYQFEITDNGIGMSDSFQRHLFEPFSREKTLAVANTEGSGLGLSIVKKIVTKAKGTIRVSSKKGKGSTFIVLIPFRVMNEKHIQRFIQRKTAENAQSNNVILTGKKILLVEDNEMNREIASEILEEIGLLVDTAEDGEFAVRKVETNGVDYYDYILMDIMMPYMNGYEATRLIRQMPGGNKIPIIALSANAYDQDRRLSLEAGMNDHLNKPVSVKTLIETLQKLGR